MKFGLSDEVIEKIAGVFRTISLIEKVVLYGSRAKGNYRNGSDIDITLYGNGLTLTNSVYPLMDALDELWLPYSFDISIYDQIDNQALRDHIDRIGKTLYERRE